MTDNYISPVNLVPITPSRIAGKVYRFPDNRQSFSGSGPRCEQDGQRALLARRRRKMYNTLALGLTIEPSVPGDRGETQDKQELTMSDLQEYYTNVRKMGKLRTDSHAARWSTAVLKTFGLYLDRSTKKALANALPADLSKDLRGVFWLAHFRDKTAEARTFQKQVARRSGNTDATFARFPILAVFNQVKAHYADDPLRSRIANSLAPELRELWEQA